MKRTLWLASERGHDGRMRQHKGEVARAYWRELIEAQAKSGQNVAEFCRARGVPRTCFFAWRRKLEAAPAATQAFLEVKLAPAPAGLVLELGQGRQIKVEAGFDAGLLRRLLEALEA